MQKYRKLSARILSMALSVTMMAAMLPAAVSATEGDVSPGTGSIGTIQSFDRLGDRFIPSTGKDAPDHIYALTVALNTPVEDLQLPTEVTAMVERAAVDGKESGTVADVEAVGTVEAVVGVKAVGAVETVEASKGTAVPNEDPNINGTVSGNKPVDSSSKVEKEVIPVTWNSDREYKSDVNGKFIYSAELTGGYILADGVKLPQIYVAIGRGRQAGNTDSITVTINGSVASGNTLEGAISAASVSPEAVTSLTVTAGKVNTDDWKFLRYLPGLTTFEIDSSVTDVANIPNGDKWQGSFPYKIVTVTVPQAITIDRYAFNNCNSLTTVNFPAATAIGETVFVNCSSLTTANFPEVTTLGYAAFRHCNSLTTASFSKLPSVGEDAFKDCYGLTSASFPAATTIKANAFDGCTSLTSLQLPAAPPSVGKDAFGDVLSCALIYVNANGVALRGSALTEAQTAYSNDPAAAVADGKWYGCTIVSPVTTFITVSINGSPCEGTTLQDAVSRLAGGAASVTSLIVTDGEVTEDDWKYLSELTALQTFEIADSETVTVVESIPDGEAFPATLTSVTVPQEITVGNDAFMNSLMLTTASFPKVTSIGRGAFDGCAALTTLKLPAAAPAVLENAFRGCPDSRALVFVDAGGNALTGDALANAQKAYQEDARDGDVTNNLWYGWQVTETPGGDGGDGGNGGGSPSGGGSSSDDGGSSPDAAPAPARPAVPVTGAGSTNAAVDSKGNATAHVTDKNISDAVKAAKNAAAQRGMNAGEVTAVIHVTSPADSNPGTMTVNLPKTVQQQIISSKIGSVTVVIDKPGISIAMNLAAITEMNRQANADIALSATRTGSAKLSEEAKAVIGSRPAFDLKATFANGSGSITGFGAGAVTVTIPYTLQKGETAGGLYAVCVDDKGKVNYLSNSVYNAEAKVLRFAAGRFSVYGIGYKAPTKFSDTAAHWAKTDIEFVVNRGFMSGTGSTAFSPDSAMTRGMFVTALGRLAGVDVNSYKTGNFTDVKADAYYAPYVNWAADKGIMKGTDDTFAPDQAVSRQEMAVMMSSCANALGYRLPATRNAVTFADSTSIGSWAAPAVKQLQMAGILNGRNSNSFDPTGAVTRGEISAMLHRYVELGIDRTTGEGWTTNDSGSSLYYQNGRAVTGTQTINGVTYNFNGYGETTR